MSASARTSSVVLHGIHADVWHAHALAGAPQQVRATGHPELDAQLPGGGWPVGALTEILQAPGVHSEWRLLLPALARCGDGPVLLVGAPHLPFAPALAAQGLAAQRLLCVAAHADAMRLWSSEQALRCADVDAVLLWVGQARNDQLRRLQMAASEFHKLLFVMRPAAAQAEASPAALRVHIQPQAPHHTAWQPLPTPDLLQLQLLKRRGPPLDAPVYLSARSARLQVHLAASQAYALDRAAAIA